MSKKLFDVLQEGCDPKNRQVMICQTDGGFHVYKPRTGAKSKTYPTPDHEELQADFNRECGCSQNASTPVEETEVATVATPVVQKAATKVATKTATKKGK